tara:strand:+ start:2205 stop:3170 length:966 start_codon:yes stop_codon:yes gene_type:complete
MPIFFVFPGHVSYSDLFDSSQRFRVAVQFEEGTAFEDWAAAAGASASFATSPSSQTARATLLLNNEVDFVAIPYRESARKIAAILDEWTFVDEDGNILSEERLDAWVTEPDIANGIAAAYGTLLDGVPNKAGFIALMDGAVSTNFGAGPGPVFNVENIFINLTNNLVQGNSSARAKFEDLASGNTLAEKIASLYQAIIPASHQTSEGLAFLTRADGIKFYQQVAAERGVAGNDGAAIIALASLLKIAVEQEIGIGNAVGDLFDAIVVGTDALPDTGNVLIDIEIADGTQYDGDDAAASASSAESEKVSLVGVSIGQDLEFG